MRRIVAAMIGFWIAIMAVTVLADELSKQMATELTFPGQRSPASYATFLKEHADEIDHPATWLRLPTRAGIVAMQRFASTTEGKQVLRDLERALELSDKTTKRAGADNVRAVRAALLWLAADGGHNADLTWLCTLHLLNPGAEQNLRGQLNQKLPTISILGRYSSTLRTERVLPNGKTVAEHNDISILQHDNIPTAMIPIAAVEERALKVRRSLGIGEEGEPQRVIDTFTCNHKWYMSAGEFRCKLCGKYWDKSMGAMPDPLPKPLEFEPYHSRPERIRTPAPLPKPAESPNGEPVH